MAPDHQLTAPDVLAMARALDVTLRLADGELMATGPRSGVTALAPSIRACKPEIVKMLAKKPIDQMRQGPNLAPAPPPDWTPPPPAPDPGLPRLLALADRYCTAIQASDKARKDWRSDIEAAPAQDRGGLAAYLRGELSKLVPPVAPKAVPPTATPAPTAAQTWRQADRADQLHYWSCTQCRTGPKCGEGQRLSDIYIEAATRERFIGAKPDPAKPMPKFHMGQPWNVADKEYQAHHGQCPTCKAAARSNGHSDRCAVGQHLYTAYESAFEATKESK